MHQLKDNDLLQINCVMLFGIYNCIQSHWLVILCYVALMCHGSAHSSTVQHDYTESLRGSTVSVPLSDGSLRFGSFIWCHGNPLTAHHHKRALFGITHYRVTDWLASLRAWIWGKSGCLVAFLVLML